MSRSIAKRLKAESLLSSQYVPLPSVSPVSSHRRRFFGVGEIVGVLANPGETVRQINESRKMLAEARQELKDARERSQIPTKHTFSPLPGFFERKRELKAIERVLAGVPTFTVLFGASSAGKTALLRQVLSDSRFHVLHFDLRIAGFADLASLYFSLSEQMEQYFATLKDQLEGYDAFEKESWAFKHDRAAMEKRLEGGGEAVKTADIAHLMELFQSAMLKYWEFEPSLESETEEEKAAREAKDKTQRASLAEERTVQANAETDAHVDGERTKQFPPKKIPVFFLDEAHKLPALIQTDSAMKSLLDAMLVLTKQDRLIHCLHATSDSFYLHWLRQMNTLQHCQLLAVGDPSPEEAKTFYEDRLLPTVPESLRSKLQFDQLFEVFGGKLAHLGDYVADFINSEGKLPLKESSHYLQAYTLLNLHLVHSATDSNGEAAGKGFHIHSPITNHDKAFIEEGPAAFSSTDLLSVMKRLKEATYVPWTLDYFKLCRELGPGVVDGMVRGRILELRWTPSITLEETFKDDIRPPFRGPELRPTTPVMRYAMSQIVDELA